MGNAEYHPGDRASSVLRMLRPTRVPWTPHTTVPGRLLLSSCYRKRIPNSSFQIKSAGARTPSSPHHLARLRRRRPPPLLRWRRSPPPLLRWRRSPPSLPLPSSAPRRRSRPRGVGPPHGNLSHSFLDTMAEASRSCRCEARSFCDSSHGQPLLQLRMLSSALKGITDATGGGWRCYRRRAAVLPNLRGGAAMGTAVLPLVGVLGGAAMAGSSAPRSAVVLLEQLFFADFCLLLSSSGAKFSKLCSIIVSLLMQIHHSFVAIVFCSYFFIDFWCKCLYVLSQFFSFLMQIRGAFAAILLSECKST